jgi:hypothetical protein
MVLGVPVSDEGELGMRVAVGRIDPSDQIDPEPVAAFRRTRVGVGIGCAFADVATCNRSKVVIAARLRPVLHGAGRVGIGRNRQPRGSGT